MSVLSVRMSKEEYELLQKYSTLKNMSMNQAIKQAFFERLEDEYDIEIFDKAYAEFLKNPKTYSKDEIIKDLDL